LRITAVTQSESILKAESPQELVDELEKAQFSDTEDVQADIAERCEEWDGSQIETGDPRVFLFELMRVGVITDFHVQSGN
jgi:hypothetical protein